MHQDGTMRVLVAHANHQRRAELASTLEVAGYDVAQASTEDQALSTVHQSVGPFVVVLDVRHLHILNIAAADLRLTGHHAYVLICPQTVALDGTCEESFPHLSLYTLREPHHPQALLDTVARASRSLRPMTGATSAHSPGPSTH